MNSSPQPGPIHIRNLIPTAKKVFAVGSGKGGVGKSTIATNLAVALQKLGATVGLLDADIYGPSIPKMMATEGASLSFDGEKIYPIEGHGVKTISMGNLVPPDRATIWRGPMLHQALQRLMGGVAWGPLDYVVIDLPPGTGDVHLSMIQSLQVDGGIIVSTPQEVALADVRKCINMFTVVNVPISGLIENMSYFVCNHGERYEIFGHGGARRYCESVKIPFLGEIPLVPEMMAGGEAGVPYAITDRDDIFKNIAVRVRGRVVE